jgi:hypothetical protein
MRDRFELSRAEISDADSLFRGFEGSWDLARSVDFQVSNVTKEEMIWLYNQKMVPKGSTGRVIYDVIRASARNGICPQCGLRQVMTLDHYLPKSAYPALSVSPVNLIPSCTDCNKIKLASVASTIHPYFDDVEIERWLYANVVERSPASVSFFVQAPGSWSRSLVRRLRSHFELLGLNKLYSSEAARMLANVRLQLSELHGLGGGDVVQKYLTDLARSAQAANLNSWETALFEALAASNWFCATGFNLGAEAGLQMGISA